MEVDLNTYGRSTFNTSTKLVTSMSSGTVVPVWVHLGLPGAHLKIKQNAKVITQPTVAALLSSFDLELHTFEAPLRLYQAELMMDKLDVGLDISQIKLPQMQLLAAQGARELQEQIHPSSIFNYLNIAGLGRKTAGTGWVIRQFLASPWLMYWEVVKNYFANKQEGKGAVIHTPVPTITQTVNGVKLISTAGGYDKTVSQSTMVANQLNPTDVRLQFNFSSTTKTDITGLRVLIEGWGWMRPQDVFATVDQSNTTATVFKDLKSEFWGWNLYQWGYAQNTTPGDQAPQVTMFDLKEIDNMRTEIMKWAGNPSPFTISGGMNIAPYKFALEGNEPDKRTSAQYNQEGLALTTYKSDLFNNWLKTEWVNNINIASRIDTTGGSITIDEINIRKKMQDYLNRVAVAGGSYNDYINVTYTVDSVTRAISPIYHGSLLKEIGFEEIISNAATSVSGVAQPLGQIAGKGVMGDKHKGGELDITVKEYSILMTVAVIRPRVCYSQGNHWMMNIKNLDQIHRPIFDKIGFQDLITDQMDYRSTNIDSLHLVTFKSIGKQTAWINYQTDISRAKGNFARANNQMAQVLDRRYEWSDATNSVLDFTSYIDPAKFNWAFADTRIDAQNFNLQFTADIEERLVMSAKQMPTL